MELFIFARVHARRGQETALAAALRDEVHASRQEAGCLSHHAFRSTRDPRLFFIHSRWADEAAFESHAELAHTRTFVKRIEPLIDHPLDVIRARLLD
jgi:quinol monooxygenase YgiN